MKKTIRVGLAAALTLCGTLALAQSLNVTLRGGTVDDQVAVDRNYDQMEGRIKRNYRQQPPLVPHSIAQYQIDLRTNQCLGCHDWSKAGERNAPTLSMTHYLDREGRELDQIAGTRYFCNQCHVPQANAPALVENLFQPSIGR
ncbi:nitrate reductase cytochrome c-type subunit [Primorskyibacter sp. S187A]|uniref:nitrate reductase cytochrome c-type subunit n=1 Tax=Primorskyibacter sp. S187A TaxID=3415130 RepID=UPI003C7B2AF4